MDSWLSRAIVYQIYPRSFKDSNGDGVGDLKGIIEKLDYIKDLGINVIWLSPIYPSPMADFGYDVSDYKNIDPLFGSLQDFILLVKEAHERDIKVLMDFIPNHTSIDHIWFKQSRSSKDNPKRDYYIWATPKEDGSLPNNWQSVFGGSAWEKDDITGEYYLHTFVKQQPDLNWRNPDVVAEMLDVLRLWLELGVDGFRVDVPYHMFKDKNFEDEPINPAFVEGSMDPYHKLIHTKTVNLPESLMMVGKFMDLLNTYGEKFLVTENYTHLDELVNMYKKVDSHFFAPFNFHLASMPFRATTHHNFVDQYDQSLANLYLPTFVLGSHDKSRVVSRIGSNLAKLAAVLIFTLRGIPFVYYGEEIGMENVYIPPELVQDPFEKNVPGMGLGRDPQRTPMQWNDRRFAGFSKVNPWLPLNQNYFEVNVAKESKDKTSFLNLYKSLIHLRRNLKSLTLGQYHSWVSDNENIFCYTRSYRSETVLICLNYADTDQTTNTVFREGEILLSSYLDTPKQRKLDLGSLNLRPYEGLVLKVL